MWYISGNLGGCRAVVALRPHVTELSAFTIPSSVIISQVQNNITEDGKIKDNQTLQTRFDAFLDQFEWFATAIKQHKQTNPPPK